MQKAKNFIGLLSIEKKAINELMWNEHDHCWYDLFLRSNAEEKENPLDVNIKYRVIALSNRTSVSNYLPLWANILPLEAPLPFPTDAKIQKSTITTVASSEKIETVQDQREQIIQSLLNSGLIQNAGIQCTNVHTGEQWDAPNAWPPLEHFLLMAILKSSIFVTDEGDRLEDREKADVSPPGETSRKSLEIVLSLVDAWLSSNYKGYQESGGYMYEKYNANISGARGEGGEYTPQVGFGWTNGVVLHLLLVIGLTFVATSSQLDQVTFFRSATTSNGLEELMYF